MATKKKDTAKKTSPDFRDAESVAPGDIRLTNDFDDATLDVSSFYVDRLIPLLTPLAEMIRDKELSLSPYSTPKMRGIFNTVMGKDGLKKLRKQELADLYTSFSADIINVIAVIKADKRYEKAWKLIVQHLIVSSKDIKACIGRWPALEINYGWYGDNLAPEVLFFPLVAFAYWREYNVKYDTWFAGEFTLPGVERRFLADFLFGRDFAAPHLSKELPDADQLVTANFEGDISTDIITLEGLALNGSLLTASGLITAPKLKKVRQQTDIKSFPAQADEYAVDRIEMLCFAYFNMLEADMKDKGDADAGKLARFAVRKIPQLLKGPNFGILLPAFQGFTKAWTSENFAPVVIDTVHSILRLAHQEWLSLANFRMLLLCSPISRTNLALRLFSPHGIAKRQLVRKIDKLHETDRKWEVDEIDWFEEVGFPFAVHWIKFLCALGIVETASVPDVKPDDTLEGMRYVRLTPLGRFAFEIDKKYTPPTAANLSDVEFDSQNAIITVDLKSPYQMFLERIAKRISPTRFRISVESLLKGCRNKAELEQRISNVKVIIDPAEQPAMKEIIDEALNHTGCAMRDGGYSLLRLRPDLPGLREAILTNKELREMTILAGPTIALVKTHKMDRFNTILASYGYLMD